MAKKYGTVITIHWEGDGKPDVFICGDRLNKRAKDALCDKLDIIPFDFTYTWKCTACGWQGQEASHDCKDSVLQLFANSDACSDLKDK